MYVEIKTKDADRVSSGKTMGIGTDDYEITIEVEQKERRGDQKFLRLTATDFDSRGTGERDGKIRNIHRELEIQLDGEDLEQIVNCALEAGMLKVTVAEV